MIAWQKNGATAEGAGALKKPDHPSQFKSRKNDNVSALFGQQEYDL